MAEKILNTRIQLKYDLYENWMGSSIILKQGEAAIATIEAQPSAVKDTEQALPHVLIKFGDGENLYKDLPFASALAADVYSWAKQADKPTYTASEISGMDAYVSEYVNDQMGISVDTDTQYQLVKVNDYSYKLQSKGKGDQAWADVAGSAIAIPNDTATIEALQVLVGETAVAEQIAAAITALDLANTYEAQGEAAKVQTALETYQTTNDTAVQKVAADLTEEAAVARAAEKANSDAIVAIKDGTTIDSFADVESALADKEAAGAAVQALVDAKAYADGKDAAIAEAKKAGTDAQVYAEGVAADLADEVERAEGIEAGFESRIAANEGAITKLNANAETDGSVDYKIAQAVAAIMENPDDTMNSINELVTWINGHAEDALDLSNKVTANEEAITDLEGLVGETSVEAQITAAIDALKIGDYAKAADLAAAVARVAKNETDIAGLVTRMDTAEGDIVALETEVAKKANDADLAAIAKSGNVNDLVQSEGDVLVFYCGTASEVIG